MKPNQRAEGLAVYVTEMSEPRYYYGTKEQIERKKLAVKRELINELLDGAWNVLHDHPGCDLQEWMEILCKEYPLEIGDAIGCEEKVVNDTLSQWWHEMPYTDSITGITMLYHEWAKKFSCYEEVIKYDDSIIAGDFGSSIGDTNCDT